MRGGRIPAGLFVGLLLAACSGEDAVGNVEGGLQVTPATLVFERGFVGHEARASVRLQNTGLTELSVEVAIEGPFRTDAGPYRLTGGADVSRTIVFTPGAAGTFAGVVRYTEGGETFAVELAGTAVVPEGCVPPSPCHEAWFDPETERCEVRPFAEGARCETGNACIVDATCGADHVCRGTPLDCNDGNACTDDTCDSGLGCVRAQVHCPEPANPCLRAICDRERGCDTTEAQDGTTCGESTGGGCVDQLCRQGRCEEEVEAPGDPCSATCGVGACVGRECVRPDAGSFDAAPQFATAPVTPDRELVFPGLVAEDGTLVWLEAALDGSHTVLAAIRPNPDGERAVPPFVPRFRDDSLAGVPDLAGAILAGDRVVVALRGPGGPSLEARRLADGTRPWGPVELAPLLPFEPTAPPEVAALVDGGGGAVVVAVRAGATTALLPFAADGTPLPPVGFDGALVAEEGTPGAVADADGRLYLTLRWPELAGEADVVEVVSLYADLSPRWRQPATDGEGGVLAVANGLLVTAPGHVRATDDGVPLTGLPLLAAAGAAGPAPAPLLSLVAGYGIDGGDLATPPALVSFDPFTFEALASRPLAVEGVPGSPFWTAPVLTSRDNAVVALQLVPEGETTAAMLVSQVVEVRRDGEDARACLVPGLGRLAGPPTLRGGWFALAERQGAVKLYRLSARSVESAAWGWAGPHGGPGGGNREGP